MSVLTIIIGLFVLAVLVGTAWLAAWLIRTVRGLFQALARERSERTGVDSSTPHSVDR